MYLNQNYLQLIQYAGQYESLDDYGVLKVCQSLIRVELYDQFDDCYSELDSRAQSQDGTLKGQLDETFPIDLTNAIFDSMRAEVAANLGNHEQAVMHGERAVELVAGIPYSVNTVVDVAATDFEALRVLLRAYPALDDKANTLHTIERAKGLARYRYRGDKGFRLIVDLKIFTMLTEAYFSIEDYEQALDYSEKAISGLDSLGLLERSLYSTLTVVNTAMTGQKTLDGKFQTFADSVFANKLLPRIIYARSQLELGNFEAARAGFDEVLSTRFITGIPRLYYPVLHDRGRVAEALRDDQAATDYYRQSIEVIETSRSSIANDSGKISYVGNKQGVYQSLVQILYRQGLVDAAFEVSEDARARALVDLLASKDLDVLSPEKAAAANELIELEAAITAKSLEQRATSRSADQASYRRTVSALKEEEPEFASLVTVSPANLQEIQGYLADEELLLAYYTTKDRLYIFAVTRESNRAVTLEVAGLPTLVEDFRASIFEIDEDDYLQLGGELYQLLIAPVAMDVAKATSITVVPHGVLHYTPFDALHSGEQFLLDLKPTRVLPSASVMAFINKSTLNDESLLILGNPDLKDASMDLAGAEQEARQLAARVPGSKLLLREEATETELKSIAVTHRIIHFASHGVYDSSAPLQSRLLLAKDEWNDGRLTVAELYNLDLRADLVTLSACETALGKVATGDDVVGFSRGFLYAGANSIVSSLWEVDDIATYELMLQFYANLEKLDKRTALTQAQRTIRARYQHPFYWAAFQLTGAT